MSFDSIERSTATGRPVELYEFRYGSAKDAVYRYTNADKDITDGGVVYKAIPIRRETYKSSGKTDKTTMSIKVPENADISQLFTAYPPTQPVTVIMRAGHLSDGQKQYLAVWSGRVLSTAKNGNETELTCENTLVSLKRPGLRANWQYGCRHVLYGDGCKADQIKATRNTTVAEITTDGTIVLPHNWNAGTDFSYFNGGMLRWSTPNGTEYRTIRKCTETGLAFNGPLRGLEVGMDIAVILGCNHKTDQCLAVHDNILNYGGQPWIPLKNPAKHHPFW